MGSVHGVIDWSVPLKNFNGMFYATTSLVEVQAGGTSPYIYSLEWIKQDVILDLASGLNQSHYSFTILWHPEIWNCIASLICTKKPNIVLHYQNSI